MNQVFCGEQNRKGRAKETLSKDELEMGVRDVIVQCTSSETGSTLKTTHSCKQDGAKNSIFLYCYKLRSSLYESVLDK